MTDESIVAEEIAQRYTAMGHSVDLINAILAGTECQDDTDENMTAANAAIAAGK